MNLSWRICKKSSTRFLGYYNFTPHRRVKVFEKKVKGE